MSMNIAEDRLIPLVSLNDYAEALTKGPKKGGVAAVVEELPYVEIFLETKCGFTRAGDPFTKGGWGFVRLSSFIYKLYVISTYPSNDKD